jgi:hypothetical protein
MKYLTREWYVKARLSYIDGMVRCSKLAEKYDESFYQAVYNKRLKKFHDGERAREEFRDPQEDLKRYDAWINEPNISQEEKERRIEYKKITMFLEKERFETGKYYQYDEAFSRKLFDVDLMWRMELISHLPDYILSEVADVRILALGYASKRVKTLLKEYCKQLRREYKKVLGKAQIETNKAESKLTKRIMANEYSEFMLQRIYQKNGNVFLAFDSGALKVVNGEIIEQEEKRLYQYKRKEPYSGWSMVLYAEVSYENGLFVLHLMIDNKDKIGQSKYWYLTVQGTSIIECKGSYLSYVPDFVKVEYKD